MTRSPTLRSTSSTRLMPALFAAALVTAFLATGCSRKDEDGPLHVFHGWEKDDVKSWDPANAYDSVSLDLGPSVIETLYQYSYLSEKYQIEPLLAEGMPRYSADRKTVTIKIKKGILYHDDPCFKATQGKGREVVAQDFVYEIKRLAQPSLQSQGYWIFDGKMAGINAFHDKLVTLPKDAAAQAVLKDNVEGVQALDEHTLQLKLLKPYPQLNYILAMEFTSPVPPEAVAAYGDQDGNITDNPVGSGPFFLKSWERNHRILLDKNPTYHADLFPSAGAEKYKKSGVFEDAGKQLPFLDRVSIDIIKEDNPRWLNFMAGKTDGIVIPKDNLQGAIINQVNLAPELAQQGIRLQIEIGVIIRYISFNMKDKIVGGPQGKLLRQAMSLALDRDDWIKTFTYGTGKLMTTALPPGIPDRIEDSHIVYDFNLARAKDLMKQAGYPNGEGLPPIAFDLRGAASTDRQLGDFLTRVWGAIGIKLNVIPNTFPAYLEKAKQGNLVVSYGGWEMDYPDGENIYQLLYGPNQSPGPNDANYDNPVMNNLYNQISVMESGPKRAALMKKMDEILQEDCPWIFGYYEAEYTLSHPWVLNYRNNRIIQNKYKYYRIDKDLKKRYLGYK